MIFSIKKEYLENITGISKKISQGEFQKRDYEYAIIGRMLSPKQMNFREKNPNDLRPPSPSFSKNHVANFAQSHAQKVLSKICSIYFWIENAAPPGTFPKIHSFW